MDRTEMVAKWLEALRFSESNHLGLGDIRLTIGQQEELLALLDAERLEGDEYDPEFDGPYFNEGGTGE